MSLLITNYEICKFGHAKLLTCACAVEQPGALQMAINDILVTVLFTYELIQLLIVSKFSHLIV